MINEYYSMSVGKIPQLMQSIQSAGVPEKFTFEFLKTLGYTSSNDRSHINVLRGIGFLDSVGTPTDKYRQYKNRTESGKILAEALRTAYSDVFLADEGANAATTTKLQGIFASKTGKGEAVVDKMVSTFKAFASIADFQSTATTTTTVNTPKLDAENIVVDLSGAKTTEDASQKQGKHSFHYNIQIHLPVTKDIAVYNSIFKSMRDNLF